MWWCRDAMMEACFCGIVIVSYINIPFSTKAPVCEQALTLLKLSKPLYQLQGNLSVLSKTMISPQIWVKYCYYIHWQLLLDTVLWSCRRLLDTSLSLTWPQTVCSFLTVLNSSSLFLLPRLQMVGTWHTKALNDNNLPSLLSHSALFTHITPVSGCADCLSVWQP